MAAGQGASLRELMERMGHSSPRAALIYQHATRERDEAIAAGMGKLLKEARKQARCSGGSGTQWARCAGHQYLAKSKDGYQGFVDAPFRC